MALQAVDGGPRASGADVRLSALRVPPGWLATGCQQVDQDLEMLAHQFACQGAAVGRGLAPVPLHPQLLVQCVFCEADAGCGAFGLDRPVQQTPAYDRAALREFSGCTVYADAAEGGS